MRFVKPMLAVFISSILYVSPSLAQSAPIEDEVIVTGTIRGGDPAMGAFFSGDYETAKVEFEKNFRRIKRDEMQMQNNARAASNNTFGSELIAGPGTTSASGGTSDVQNESVSPNLSALAGRARRTGEGVTSGTDLGFQIYMVGMSQLQLKEYDPAKDSFRQALGLNKSLYDARLRLGLLELRDGNIEGAQKQMTGLRKSVKRCRNVCSEKVELLDAEAVLLSALEKTRS